MATLSQIKQALEQCVAGGKCLFMNYGRFSTQNGFGPYAPAWANKTTLDDVAVALKHDPNVSIDLTFLLFNNDTKYPSVIDGLPSNPPSAQQKVRAREVAQQIIDRYAPGTKNPY